MKKVLFIFSIFILPVVLCGGCKLAALAVSPGAYDRKVPAEFPIKDRASEKVLVVVEESAAVGTGILFRQKLASAIDTMLVDRAKIGKKNLVSQSEIEFMSKTGGLYRQSSPTQLARDLGAGLVLYVRIMDYKLYPSGPEDYYVGSLISRAALMDARNDTILWPVTDEPKIIRMEVDLETKGVEATNEKLFSSTAHGIVRHLYDVRVRHFKTSCEQRQYDRQW